MCISHSNPGSSIADVTIREYIISVPYLPAAQTATTDNLKTRRCNITYHSCQRPPRHQQENLCARSFQVETQLLRQRVDGGLGGIVGRVAGRIRNPLFAARDDYCGGRGGWLAGLEGWDEGIEPVEDTEDVRAENLRWEMSALVYGRFLSTWSRY